MSKVRGSACGRTSTVKAGSNTTDAENSWLSVQQRVGKFCRLICAAITSEGLLHHFKSDSQIGAENFHSDISQNNVIVGPYDSP